MEPDKVFDIHNSEDRIKLAPITGRREGYKETLLCRKFVDISRRASKFTFNDKSNSANIPRDSQEMVEISLKREDKKDNNRQQEEGRRKSITSQSRDGINISETLEGSKHVENLPSFQPAENPSNTTPSNKEILSE